LKALIVEDTVSLSLDYEMILDDLGVEVMGVYKSWQMALPVVKKNLPDLMIVDLFLDNNERGLDFVEEMKDYFVPTIICTGYPETEYMDQALKAGVRSFISKPIDKAALVYEIRKLLNEQESDKITNDFLLVKDKKNTIRVPFDEICKIQIEGNYSFVYLNSNKKYILKISLNKLLSQINNDNFIRCHRSMVINLSLVESLNLSESKLTLTNGSECIIGNKYKAEIKKAYFNLN
jgi:DNA-binding LytR/AlgR family response regulator